MGGRQNTSNSTEKRWNRGRQYGKIEVNYDDNISTQEEERKQITVRRPSLQTKRTVIYSRSSSGNPQLRQIRSRWGRCQICPANSNRRYTCRTLVECWQEVYSEHEKSGFQPRTDIYTLSADKEEIKEAMKIQKPQIWATSMWELHLPTSEDKN